MNKALTPLERFASAVDEFLSFQLELVTDLNQEGLTTVQPHALRLAKVIIKSCGTRQLITALAKCHQDWHLIIDRDSEFIVDSLARRLETSGIMLDANLLSVPFVAYNQIINSNQWKGCQPDDLPINEEDINQIWDYFKLMVSITCDFIHHERAPQINRQGDVVYSNPSFMPEIDLTHFAEMFGVDLTQ